ncbi:hypothetical protein lbkm_3501 [Lachnospiraceae bacterium KM106-2]|nr:hypothetical protein lbkm_3501 [Lachnospiraceae bacterium KM106-2]
MKKEQEQEKEKSYRELAYQCAIIIFMVGVIAILGMKYISGENRRENLQYEQQLIRNKRSDGIFSVEAVIVDKNQIGNAGVVTIQIKSSKMASMPRTIECEANEEVYDSISEGENGVFELQNMNGSYQIIAKQ